MLQKRATQAGVPLPVSLHDLRRSFISDLLDSGADISLVAKLSGHRQLATVARYDRRDAEAQKRAASLLHVPFQTGQS